MDGNRGCGPHAMAGDDPLVAAPRGPDKSRRDEWSEGGVLCLLEVYESKWLLRNRAKLKGSDWEEIAHQVSHRSSGTKTIKTPSQCKNKIESMKKRYRAESALANQSSSSSSWQFYVRMDSLLKGTTNSPVQFKSNDSIDLQTLPKAEIDGELERNLHVSNQDDGSNTVPVDVNANANDDDNNNNNNNNEKRQSRGMDSDISSPRSKEGNARERMERNDNPSKRRRGFESEVAESIRLLAHSMVKIEQVRLEMYKDSERMRVEAEIKRGEMELKRTEIIAKTQLQIAKLFSRRFHGRSNKSGSSSLGAETDAQPRMDEMTSVSADLILKCNKDFPVMIQLITFLAEEIQPPRLLIVLQEKL